MTDPMYVLDVRFLRAWQTLAAGGWCDDWGSSACERIYRAYCAAGRPRDVHQFIRHLANATPPADPPRGATAPPLDPRRQPRESGGGGG